MLPLGFKLRVLHEVNAPLADEDVYWLSRCEGFSVYDQDGRIGIVHDVRLGQTIDMPDNLVVRTGLFVRKLVLIPIGQIEGISPHQRRVLLRTQPDREPARMRRGPAAYWPRLGAMS